MGTYMYTYMYCDVDLDMANQMFVFSSSPSSPPILTYEYIQYIRELRISSFPLPATPLPLTTVASPRMAAANEENFSTRKRKI